MNSSHKSKRFRADLKAKAVRLLLTSGKSQAQSGRQLGVSGASLAKWIRQAIRHGDNPSPKDKDSKIDYSVLEEENFRLKLENETLRRQREILTKSIGLRSADPLQKGMA
jgi:transposase-like protein